MDQSGRSDSVLDWRLSAHPITLLTFLAVRFIPVALYLLGVFLVNDFILVFIITLLLLSADFYYLKNIAGRRLVGLRWWNEALPLEGAYGNVPTSTTNATTGLPSYHVQTHREALDAVTSGQSSKWVFEAPGPESIPTNKTDVRFFWLTVYGVPLIWLGLALVAILKFELIWLSLVIVALILSGTNALAFSRCDKFGKAEEVFSGASGYVGGMRAASLLFRGTIGRFFNR